MARYKLQDIKSQQLVNDQIFFNFNTNAGINEYSAGTVFGLCSQLP